MDVISSHLSVLLLPLALDALLWFGPRLSVRSIMASIFDQVVTLNIQSNLPVKDLLENREEFVEVFTHFNLLAVLRTFPVGVSSLLSGNITIANPLGAQSVFEVGSEGSLIGWLFLLTFAGWALGGLYFNWVSAVTGQREAGFGFGRAMMQTLFFSAILTGILFMIGVPAIFFLGILGLINPGILQVTIFILVLLSAWIVVPVFFAPHGMYLRGQNAFYSIYASLRMARFTLPTSSMFVLAVFVISQGLNFLWAVPADDSWMRLVGIVGHAFVTTALLAASFIYYRDLNAWLEIVFERLKPDTASPQI
ncbi:MAG: hypothetical protein C4583_11715 [Anaerolineaceae bacterium]|nr:MAG: hypothetical protein C4583_11715 [Anaerolineaceae bacterium]